MPKATKFETVFAVMDESNKEKPVLLGTAFAIKGGAFATAGHIADALKESKSPTLRKFEEDGTVAAIPIKQSETWKSIDFGLIYADFQPKEIISWLDARAVEPTDVDCLGFAYGFDLQRKKLTMRHFKGYIVSCQRYNSWEEMDMTKQGEPDYPFWTYELSFA